MRIFITPGRSYTAREQLHDQGSMILSSTSEIPRRLSVQEQYTFAPLVVTEGNVIDPVVMAVGPSVRGLSASMVVPVESTVRKNRCVPENEDT